ncbi:hypothetical protein KFU94_42200 [Chloroflexi bacterium TSY]|nr:hypothetical protein [Chloroflexi bacterium TSY]
MITQVNPRIIAVARIIESFTESELSQLLDLVPVLRQRATDAQENENQDEVVAYFRQLIQEQERTNPLSITNEFINGMPYDEYFALSEAEQDAIWEQIFADAEIDMETIPEIDVIFNAHVPS